ncbi:MAG TPA: hypothetical protein VNN21_08860 [Dehalococcoidia bacterium]|nr:hypothetical protein [Dehalococcoidia bacterium]
MTKDIPAIGHLPSWLRYRGVMQLRVARLCLDCEEIHDAQACPVCASEAFAFLSRWVPAPERRMRPRPATSPEAEAYRELLAPNKPPRPWVKRSLVGLTIVGLAGWALKRGDRRGGSSQ